MSLRLSASDAYVVQFLPTGVIRGNTIEPPLRLSFSPPPGLEKDPRRLVLLHTRGSSFLPWGALIGLLGNKLHLDVGAI